MPDDDTFPADPMTISQQSWVALHENYVQARASGFGLVAAVLFLAAWVVFNAAANTGEDAD